MKSKLMTAMVVTLLIASVSTTYAQEGKHRPDPKTMSAKAAEKLEFTTEQKAQLASLNQKYNGTDYDRRQYREEFRQIMTDEQRTKADEMRTKHEGGMKGKGDRGKK